MAYVAVKGGEQAIQNAEALLKAMRRGDLDVPELTLEQIKQQMALAIARVMSEGSLYDPDLAALAIKQSWGDLVEAIFLLRAYRTTLPRLYYSQPIDTSQMRLQRRISSIFKDVPGGQRLGATYDYIHRLLDFKLAAEGNTFVAPEAEVKPERVPRVIDTLGQEGLIQEEVLGAASQPFDLTRQPLSIPAGRDARLQNLTRADEGFLLGMAYSTQRGYGKNHPFAGEIRVGEVEVVICPEELGFEVAIADITVTEVQMVNQFKGSQEMPPQFTRGYGLTFGYNERKAMSMALVDRALRAKEFGEEIVGPAQDEEFVLYHSDNVEAQGFVQHLKLPHYIDFQAELNLVRKMRQKYKESQINRQSSGIDRESSIVDGQSAVDNSQSSVDNSQSAVVDGQSSVVNGQSSVDNSQSAVVDGQSSVVNGQSSVVNGQSSVVNGQSAVVDGQSAVVDGQSSVHNSQSAVDNSQSSVVDGQSAVVDGQSAVVDGQSSVVDGQSAVDNSQSPMVDGQSLEEVTV